MNNRVIEKTKGAKIAVASGLVLTGILFPLMAIFMPTNTRDKIILAIVLGVIWLGYLIYILWYISWKISFNDEEFCVRKMFITHKYKREDVVIKKETKLIRGNRSLNKNVEYSYYAVRRVDNGRLIVKIELADGYGEGLLVPPTERKFLMGDNCDKVTLDNLGLVEKDGRYYSKKDNSEWAVQPAFDDGNKHESVFYKLPLASFKEITSYMEKHYEDEDYSAPAAALLFEKYPQELKQYLNKKIKDGIDKDYRDFLIYALMLTDIDPIIASKTKSDIERLKELREWKEIALHLGAIDSVIYEATINWTRPEDDGRKSGVPFRMKKYAPIIGINGQIVFEGCSWGIICYSDEKLSAYTTHAYMRFLVEYAPPILFKGTEFELYEGRKCVARGVIDKTSDDPDARKYFEFTKED